MRDKTLVPDDFQAFSKQRLGTALQDGRDAYVVPSLTRTAAGVLRSAMTV